ncbi:hypothetical protein [Acinetobacter calcoaceticus]
MKFNSFEDESYIASLAAEVLHQSFIENARTNTVLYVENDAIWSKSPNSIPVLIKQLPGRNPDLAKKIVALGTYRIKKRTISPSNE